MTPTLEAVFEELGIAQYLEAFVDQGFDSWETILDITESDLDALGVKLGHRRKLQRRIANSRGLSPSTSLASLAQASVEDAKTEGQRAEPPKAVPREVGSTIISKRKYRRHPKPDENAPERPPSAYVLFSNKMREDLRGRNLTFTEIAKLVGENWQGLTAAEKEPYETQAQVAKEKYNHDMAEYKKTEDYKKYHLYLQEFKSKHAHQSQDKEVCKRVKLSEPASSSDNGGTRTSGASNRCDDQSKPRGSEPPPRRLQRLDSVVSNADSQYSLSMTSASASHPDGPLHPSPVHHPADPQFTDVSYSASNHQDDRQPLPIPCRRSPKWTAAAAEDASPDPPPRPGSGPGIRRRTTLLPPLSDMLDPRSPPPPPLPVPPPSCGSSSTEPINNGFPFPPRHHPGPSSESPGPSPGLTSDEWRRRPSFRHEQSSATSSSSSSSSSSSASSSSSSANYPPTPIEPSTPSLPIHALLSSPCSSSMPFEAGGAKIAPPPPLAHFAALPPSATSCPLWGGGGGGGKFAHREGGELATAAAATNHNHLPGFPNHAPPPQQVVVVGPPGKPMPNHHPPHHHLHPSASSGAAAPAYHLGIHHHHHHHHHHQQQLHQQQTMPPLGPSAAPPPPPPPPPPQSIVGVGGNKSERNGLDGMSALLKAGEIVDRRV